MYPSDLKDKEWGMIQHYFEYGNGYGHRAKYPRKVMINSILYVVKTGCQWRFLPKEFPPWKTVYSFYKRAKDKGQWESIMQELVKKSRIHMGRASTPSYSLIDSQSVKTTGVSEDRGIDGGKKD